MPRVPDATRYVRVEVSTTGVERAGTPTSDPSSRSVDDERIEITSDSWAGGAEGEIGGAEEAPAISTLPTSAFGTRQSASHTNQNLKRPANERNMYLVQGDIQGGHRPFESPGSRWL